MKRTRGTSAGASKNWGQNESKPKKTYYESWGPYNYKKSWSEYDDWANHENDTNDTISAIAVCNKSNSSEKGLEFEQIHDWCDVDHTETND